RDAGNDPERRKRTDAADAEQQFLANPDAIVAAVQARRQLTILGLVAVDVGVEQEERVAADRQRPDTRRDCAGPRLNGHVKRRAVRQVRNLDWEHTAVEIDVLLVLPQLAIEPLLEISLVVVQPDSDERDAEVRRALD